jgi:hypothetical protein
LPPQGLRSGNHRRAESFVKFRLFHRQDRKQAGRFIPQSPERREGPARSTQVLTGPVLTLIRSPPRAAEQGGLSGPLGPGQNRLNRSGTRTCPAQSYSAPILKNRPRCGTMRETTVANLRPGRPEPAGRAGAGPPARPRRSRTARVGDRRVQLSNVQLSKIGRTGSERTSERMYSSSRFWARGLVDY